MRCVLLGVTVIRGHDTGRRIILRESDTVSLGREVGCSFRLHDPSVSRLHCRITVQGDSMLLRDADSRWGVDVNGRHVRSVAIQEGDRITIGETELLVESVSDEALPTLAPARLEGAMPKSSRGLQVPGRNRTVARPSRLRADDDIMQLLGGRFLRFEVTSLMASARTGAVFRAWDNKHEREVALKIFWPHLFQDETELRRFVRAMRTAIPLKHENLVRVYTAGRSQGVCFTSCELVEGESAAEVIQRVGVCGMLDWRRVLRIAIQVADALQAASDHAMVHRNITPHNILIRTSDDVVKLNDLVFAKAIAGTQIEQITRAGEIVGQLVYMSPEQTGIERPIDVRSDIYSLGATLYAILTGRPPLEGRTAAETIKMIQLDVPTPPTEHHLSISSLFEGEVMRMLEKRPEDRHSSPTALRHELKRVARYEGLDV